MKNVKIIIKTLFLSFFVFSVFVFLSMYFLNKKVEKSYNITPQESFNIGTILPVTATCEGESCENLVKKSGETFDVDLKMFGVIPFSTTTLSVVEKNQVTVLGTPFGMRIYTDGVMVIELNNSTNNAIGQSPAKKAGIKIGDYIKTVDGVSVASNEDLSDIVMNSKGKTLEFEIKRNGKTIKIPVTPKYDSQNGIYRIGLWVRDSSAGIGTLTFYSPLENIICGLGHGVCDNDTGKIIKIDSGELVAAEILSVQKGKKGTPGELKGKFKFETIADIVLNKSNGIYGEVYEEFKTPNLTEVALKQEVKSGNAQILTTLNGEKAKLYSCKITVRNKNYKDSTQNLTVTITDNELLSKTGGIVQGMSGSPLIQNGKLIGAITHVLVDDPTTGYAIFAENMLETAQGVANENKLKDVS